MFKTQQFSNKKGNEKQDNWQIDQKVDLVKDDKISRKKSWKKNQRIVKYWSGVENRVVKMRTKNNKLLKIKLKKQKTRQITISLLNNVTFSLAKYASKFSEKKINNLEFLSNVIFTVNTFPRGLLYLFVLCEICFW